MRRREPLDEIERENRAYTFTQRMYGLATYALVAGLMCAGALEFFGRRAQQPGYQDISGDGVPDRVWTIPEEHPLHFAQGRIFAAPRVEFGFRATDGSVSYRTLDDIASTIRMEGLYRLAPYERAKADFIASLR